MLKWSSRKFPTSPQISVIHRATSSDTINKVRKHECSINSTKRDNKYALKQYPKQLKQSIGRVPLETRRKAAVDPRALIEPEVKRPQILRDNKKCKPELFRQRWHVISVR